MVVSLAFEDYQVSISVNDQCSNGFI
jgi:hypothetical protein